MLNILDTKVNRQVSITTEDLEGENAAILHLTGTEKKFLLWLIPYAKKSHCYIRTVDHKAMTSKLVDQFMDSGSFIVKKSLDTHGVYVTFDGWGYMPRCFCGAKYLKTPMTLAQAFNQPIV